MNGQRRFRMFFQKKESVKEKKETKKAQSKKPEQKAEDNNAPSPLLERYLQKNMTDQMQVVSDEVLAKAIKTLLVEDEMKNDKHWN